MSAIVGLLARDGRPVEPEALERLVAGLADRGPDGGGAWSEGGVGLGHRLLATTPEARQEKLPLFDASGDRVLTADARLDNRDELIPALGLAGRPAGEVTDAELILHAHERWGEGCPERLLGDFAFAIWDRRTRTLFAARDALGVRPFYYGAGPRLLVFASTLEAVLAGPDISARPNETRIADYLAEIQDDHPGTFHADVRRLPPGHALTAREGEVRTRAYWTLDPAREIRLGSDDAYAEAFRDLLTDAVRRRTRTAGPLGALLSGGLDSSSVVCLARQTRRGSEGAPLPVFSGTFPELPACDERRFIDAVLAQGGLEPHAVRCDRLDPLATLVDRLGPHGAFHNPDYYMHAALYSAARDHGVRVLLGGHGGDSVVSHGFARLAELARRGAALTLARELAGVARHFPGRTRRVAAHTLRPAIPDALRVVWRRAGGARTLVPPLVNPDLARRVGLAERMEALVERRRRLARNARTDHWRQLTAGGGADTLETLDWTAGACALELRHPFLDRRLVELCLALPAEQKLRGGLPRAIQHRAMVGILPPLVGSRPDKADLGRMLDAALAAHGRERLDAALLGEAERLAPYIHLPTLEATYRRHVQGQGSRADGLAVWRAATLAVWLRAPSTRARRIA